MLGQLLEFSFTAHPIAAAMHFYRALGFEELPTGDILPSPYGVVWDGNIAIGLHDREFDSPALCFVRPALELHLRGLKRLGIELELAELADDQFNQAHFRDPDGHLIVLLEARTFSPGTWDTTNVSACGRFLEYSIAVRSLEVASSFWKSLGLEQVATGDAPHAWERLQGSGIVLGLHETASFEAALCFQATGLSARSAFLEAKGLRLTRPGTPAMQGTRSALLRAPDGPPLCLIETSVERG